MNMWKAAVRRVIFAGLGDPDKIRENPAIDYISGTSWLVTLCLYCAGEDRKNSSRPSTVLS